MTEHQIIQIGDLECGMEQAQFEPGNCARNSVWWSAGLSPRSHRMKAPKRHIFGGLHFIRCQEAKARLYTIASDVAEIAHLEHGMADTTDMCWRGASRRTVCADAFVLQPAVLRGWSSGIDWHSLLQSCPATTSIRYPSGSVRRTTLPPPGSVDSLPPANAFMQQPAYQDHPDSSARNPSGQKSSFAWFSDMDRNGRPSPPRP